jgi:hypothetical protein
MASSSESYQESITSLPQDIDREHFLKGLLQHDYVESESSLHSTAEIPRTSLEISGFTSHNNNRSPIEAQWLSGNRYTGQSTQRIYIPKGWKAPIGSFSNDLELYVLDGDVRQGGFPLRSGTYSFIPADIPTGPWEALKDTVLLWMPDRRKSYW